MRTTTAAISSGEGATFALGEVVLDQLRPDEVLVRMVATGMCHTDLSAASGAIPFPLPGVLGHEGVGRVVEVGAAVTRTSPGDAVLLTFTSCGRCRRCRGGHPALCAEHLRANLLGGCRLDGSPTLHRDGHPISGHFFGQSSFAREAVADERSVVVVAAASGPGIDDAALAALAPLACGAQTGAGAVLNVLRPATDEVLVVTGAGAVGLSAVMAAAATSVGTVVVVDVVPERLALALELGATEVVDARSEDVPARLAALGGGSGPDAVVETSGVVSVLETAMASLAVGGTCAVVGAPPVGSRASFDVQGQLPGRRVVGVTLGDSEPERFVPQLVALQRAGRFPVERLQRQYAFTDIGRAAADAAAGTTVKPVLIMGEDPS